MKRKALFGTLVLISMALATGCSFNVKEIAKYNPFKSKQSVVDNVYQNKDNKNPVKPKEEVIKEIDVMIDQMVRDVKTGLLDKAIATGEEAYAIISRPEYVTTSAAVYTAVYDAFGWDAARERLVEVLIDAYDYKNHLTGLSDDEKDRYVRTAREHLNINPADNFKKHALAKVLLETGNYAEGMKLATEAYNSNQGNMDFMETYAWGLYLSGKKGEAFPIYKSFWSTLKLGTLTQAYHSAVVSEEQDKLAGLSLYAACEQIGYNLMVLEPNINNISAQSYINKIVTDSKKAMDRLLAGGLGVDSQFNYQASGQLIHSIVRL